MAISKLILNGETQMDVTSNTNTSNNMLSGVVGTKNDGTTVTGSIATKTSSDLTASGATVTAPAGYYANAASKAVATTTHPNPSASITSSTGVVTASHTQGTGYVTSGTTTGTLSLTTQAGKTITPTETAQTAVASYRWTTGPISVAAIDSYYIGSRVPQNSAADVTIANTMGVVTAPAGYYSTAATKTLTTKAGETFYPSTADQTISSYRWLIGNQTIKSVTTSNLTAENIAEGVIVKVGDTNNASRITQITGTHSGSPSYTATICTYDSFGTSGNANYCYVSYNGTKYYTLGNTFTFKEGDILTVRAHDDFYINGTNTGFDISSGFDWVLPGSDIDIYFEYDDASSSELYIRTLDLPSDSICFYRHWDDQTQSYYYTCNKTYEQCYEILSNTADVIAYVDTPTDSRMLYIGVMMTTTSDYALRFRSYRYEVTDGVRSQILYYPDGTIEYLDTPVSIFAKIDITSNGTYTNSSRYYATINVSVQGSGFTADDIAWRTISGSISGDATTVGAYAFYSCNNLTTVSFPSCTNIGTYAFHNCSNLTTISFPVCSSIGSYAFNGCSHLTAVSFSLCSSIGGFAFYNCYNLTTISFPVCSNIGSYVFYNCSLTAASFSVCSSIGSYAFYNCFNLTTVSFPSVSYIGGSAFRNCSNLTTVNFPFASYIGPGTFSNCYNLTTASFPSVTSINNYTFYSCYKLLSLYLLGSSVLTLGTNVFNTTPIAGYTTSTGGVYGSIFVPSSLYNSYITATNWSAFSSRFVSLYTINNPYSSLTYWFENGMTWEDFIVNNSVYNNTYRPNYYFVIRNNYVRFNDMWDGYIYDVQTSNNSYVNATDTISANYSYKYSMSV